MGTTCGKVGADGGEHDGDGGARWTPYTQTMRAAEHEWANVEGVAFPLWQPLSVHPQQLLQALQQLICTTFELGKWGNDVLHAFSVAPAAMHAPQWISGERGLVFLVLKSH